MRQRVNATELSSLPSAEREYLGAWGAQYRYPGLRLTIGQLIHFLVDHGEPIPVLSHLSGGGDSLIDALWSSVAQKLAQLAQTQPVPLVRDQAAIWQQWQDWFAAAEEDFNQMLIRRQIWRSVVGIYRSAAVESPLRQYGGPYMTWLAGMYGQSQSSGVRRHADTREDVATLKRVLEDMLINHDAVTANSEFPATTEQLKQEIDELDQLAEPVIQYTNKQIAHLDPGALKYNPTFGDLNRALDHLFKLMHRCKLVLTGGDLVEEMSDATGWIEIMYHPWIADTQ